MGGIGSGAAPPIVGAGTAVVVSVALAPSVVELVVGALELPVAPPTSRGPTGMTVPGVPLVPVVVPEGKT